MTVRTAFTVGEVICAVNNLQGRVLTLVDACYRDPIQNSALKGLFKREFHTTLDWATKTANYDDTVPSK